MEFKVSHAEAMVKAANDVVSPEAAAAFDAVLTVEPGNTRAVYYKGLAKEQSGDKKAALEYWTASLKAAAPEVEWSADVKERIAKLSRETGAPAAPSPPSQQSPPNLRRLPKKRQSRPTPRSRSKRPKRRQSRKKQQSQPKLPRKLRSRLKLPRKLPRRPLRRLRRSPQPRRPSQLPESERSSVKPRAQSDQAGSDCAL